MNVKYLRVIDSYKSPEETSRGFKICYMELYNPFSRIRNSFPLIGYSFNQIAILFLELDNQ